VDCSAFQTGGGYAECDGGSEGGETEDCEGVRGVGRRAVSGEQSAAVFAINSCKCYALWIEGGCVNGFIWGLKK